jgi:hypothetical protein
MLLFASVDAFALCRVAVQFNITNWGLIAVQDLTMDVPVGHPLFEFVPQIPVTPIGPLAALSSIIVPMAIVPRTVCFLCFCF